MTRSRLFSLTVTTMVALAGLGVAGAAASIAGEAGSVVVRSIPPVCC
jgi:hypothetical protein